MKPVTYYSTNNHHERVNFETAFLNGMAPDYGLYMIDRKDIPKLSSKNVEDMRKMSYSEIAFLVLNPFLGSEIPRDKLEEILNDAYKEDEISIGIQHVTGRSHIMWLTQGPTYSFKDYAARFFGRMLNHFLGERGLRRNVIVATSGDTGGAVADALYGLDRVDNVVFFPRGLVSEGQRRQMTTLGGNIYSFEVNGDFNVCQELAKNLLGDKKFAKEVFNDGDRLTSANSISIGRLLPQAVYPFFAYSRVVEDGEKMIVSVPSGNFGDMMGSVIAKDMGLPISKILVGLNPNKPFLDFLETGVYRVSRRIDAPSSAMMVTHPSNLARLIDFYGGHMFDKRDKTKKVIEEGVIDKMPDIKAMRKDFFALSVSSLQHYETIREVYYGFNWIVLDPHGAVGWKTLDVFLGGKHNKLAVVYETADPGKFPNDIKESIGVVPELPDGMKKQVTLKERIYSIESEPEHVIEIDSERLKLSDAQVQEAKEKIRSIFN